MVAGETVEFADLFAEDSVMRFPFAPPGFPTELNGRETVRQFYAQAAQHRDLLKTENVSVVVHETVDPEVVIAQIEHHGYSRASNGPYRSRALGVIRVRDGEIVSYDDYMDTIATARTLGRTGDLVAALGTSPPRETSMHQ